MTAARTRIYHVCTRSDWDSAFSRGFHDGGPDDQRDGFLHFSTREQVEESVARHRAGQTDLVLLEVDPETLGPALRWEPARGGAPFPHLYGMLPVEAVQAVDDLPLGEDGRHRFPWHR